MVSSIASISCCRSRRGARADRIFGVARKLIEHGSAATTPAIVIV